MQAGKGNKAIAVLGGGNGAHALAADLALRGHRVRMYYRRRRARQVFETREIQVSGAFSGTARLELVTDELAKAVAGADYVCLAAPAYSHETYGHMLKGLLDPNQVLVLCPGAFGSLQMRRIWAEAPAPVIVETNNLPYGARLTGDGQVTVFGRNVVNVACMPASAGPDLLPRLQADLFDIGRLERDVVACGLSLVNPALHPGPCLVNASSIERPDVDFFLYEHGFTPAAAKLALAVDRERVAVAKALGYEDLQPVADFAHIPADYTWQQLYMAIHGNITHTVIRGPNDLEHRYLTEDIPYGLVPWVHLGRWAGVAMPKTDAIVQLFQTIHGVDWYQAGCNPAKLGIDQMQPKAFANYLQTGMFQPEE